MHRLTPALLLALAACTAAPGDDTDESPASEVTLTALDAFETDPLGTSRASVGRFVVVQVRVDNGSDAAISVAPAAFTLESQGEVEDAANATVSALVDDPCPSAPPYGVSTRNVKLRTLVPCTVWLPASARASTDS